MGGGVAPLFWWCIPPAAKSKGSEGSPGDSGETDSTAAVSARAEFGTGVNEPEEPLGPRRPGGRSLAPGAGVTLVHPGPDSPGRRPAAADSRPADVGGAATDGAATDPGTMGLDVAGVGPDDAAGPV